MNLVALRHFLGAKWRFQQLRGADLQRFQHARAVETIEFARLHSPFYRELFEGLDSQNWRAFPTVDKAAMMARFGEFNTRGVPLERAMNVALRAERERDFAPTIHGLTVGLSSGTSGHRGLFLLSREEQAAWAGTILSRTLPRWKRSPWKIAFFLRSNSNLYEETHSRAVSFRWFDLMTPLSQAVAQLNDFSPDILVAPPSLLASLAGQGALKIRPEKVISVAEPLDELDKTRLQNAFDCEVGEVYQCTEGLLGVSCSSGQLHVQEDVVALDFEPLGENRFSPIVTDLWRRVQPIVRYRLNDIVVLSKERCACGSDFQTIERIEGRCDDVCEFESQNGQMRLVWPDVLRRAILLSSSFITDYAIEQTREGTLRVWLEVAVGTDFSSVERAVQSEFKALSSRYELRPFRVEIERGVPARKLDTKRRRVRRLTE